MGDMDVTADMVAGMEDTEDIVPFRMDMSMGQTIIMIIHIIRHIIRGIIGLILIIGGDTKNLLNYNIQVS